MPCDPRRNPLSRLLLRSVSAPSLDLISGIAAPSPIVVSSLNQVETRNGPETPQIEGAVTVLRTVIANSRLKLDGPETGGAENGVVYQGSTASPEGSI